MFKMKVVFLFLLTFVSIVFYPTYSIQANIDEQFNLKQETVEIKESVLSENIPENKFENTPDNSTRCSIDFFDKECFIMVVPPPDINDLIGVSAPEINDPIALKDKNEDGIENLVPRNKSQKVLPDKNK